ncbi:helix-turn-helix domain-containing protein [Paenirhodobacter populi]|uniref:Helix-turn-helix domain-containing protein n=1 Tax=Paenirhodobacter populi TaxID=2306993 RepID=A0A443JSJ8_9RHOB|nr:helix-turn-helix domain-containing protein [Sinirhodobacter populi]RWR23456.1 helix-turn-helix domain-containing protein [Sinirhodobacter populi]
MSQSPGTSFPKPPAALAPYVEVLGVDLAVEFFLRFGGAELYFPQDRCRGGAATSMIGIEKIAELGDRLCVVKTRVPLANRWIAEVLAWKGVPTADIARWIRVSDVTVRHWLSGGERPFPVER